MNRNKLMAVPLIAVLLSLSCVSAEKKKAERVESLLGRDNLVAWCIVPFDKLNRGPEARTVMLKELGLSRCAYDWRQKHVAEFEEEILQYKKHGVEFTAFWSQHERAFELFAKYGMSPQVWQTMPSPKGETEEAKVEAAAKAMLPIVERTRKMGSQLGLYNHGGWGGQPANMTAVCKVLREKHGANHVGIVYNFHHGHADIANFEESFRTMLPYLICVNLNGMMDESELKANPGKNKIVPVGSGKHELRMIQVILDSGYEGPIGVLGHIGSEDVKVSLLNNLNGLDWLKPQLNP